jgi:hypothetical protein
LLAFFNVGKLPRGMGFGAFVLRKMLLGDGDFVCHDGGRIKMGQQYNVESPGMKSYGSRLGQNAELQVVKAWI